MIGGIVCVVAARDTKGLNVDFVLIEKHYIINLEKNIGHPIKWDFSF